GDHLPVVLPRRGVEPPRLRLDAGPLKGESVGVERQGLDQVQVVAEATEVLAGGAGARAVGDGARGLLEGPPVAAVVAALDLVRRGRHTEAEVRREHVRAAGPGAWISRRDDGAPSHATSCCTTLPATSVNRKSRPWKRHVSFRWSRP